MTGSKADGLGLGGVILRDVAGSGSLTSTKVYGSIAYHQMISDAHLLSAGFNVGWVNKRINAADLKFPDQFDGKFFNRDIPTSVFLDNPNINYFDVQAGLNYAYFPTENLICQRRRFRTSPQSAKRIIF